MFGKKKGNPEVNLGAQAAEAKGKDISFKEARKRGLRWGIIATPVIIFGTLMVIGLTNEEAFTTVLWAIFEGIMVNGGWALNVGCLFFVIFMVACIVCPFGNIRIGGRDAKPYYSTWNWFAISLCAGIGTGIMFWGAAEPLMYAANPAPGMHLQANSSEAVIWGMRTAFHHWSFTPYAIYMCFGVIVAFAYYNLKKPYNISSGFVPLLGDKVAKNKYFSGIIDALTVFAITGGVASSMGFGLLQVGGGINLVFDIPTSAIMYTLICAIIVISYNISSITGMDKGIKLLSDMNAQMYLVLMFALLFAGPTEYILNILVQASGDYFANYFAAATWTNPFADVGACIGSAWSSASSLWSQWWDQYWWTDWLSFGPITGLFLVKLMYGRTIREISIVNWLLPSGFAFIWYSIFGSVALDIQYNPSKYPGIDLKGCASLYEFIEEYGNEYAMLKIMEILPGAKIIQFIVIALIILSFVTLADSMTSTISLMTIKNNVGVNEAPPQIKLGWGLLMGTVSLVFTLLGGIDGLKVVKTIAGFPILFVEIAMTLCFLIYIIKYGKSRFIRDMMAEDIVPDPPADNYTE